jgi:hypothetical protein
MYWSLTHCAVLTWLHNSKRSTLYSWHKAKKERQCMCNVTFRHIHETTVTVESNKYKVVQIWPGLFVCKQVTVCPGHIWTTLYYIFLHVCVCKCMSMDMCLLACRLAYSVRHVHAPCCLRPLWPHHIFLTLSHNLHNFRKKVTKHKTCVLIFSTTSIWNISYFKKKSAKHCHKCENVFMSSTHFCWILLKHNFSWQIFKKSQITNFIKIPSVGAELFHADGRTWRS